MDAGIKEDIKINKILTRFLSKTMNYSISYRGKRN